MGHPGRPEDPAAGALESGGRVSLGMRPVPGRRGAFDAVLAQKEGTAVRTPVSPARASPAGQDGRGLRQSPEDEAGGVWEEPCIKPHTFEYHCALMRMDLLVRTILVPIISFVLSLSVSLCVISKMGHYISPSQDCCQGQ